MTENETHAKENLPILYKHHYQEGVKKLWKPHCVKIHVSSWILV